MTPTPTTLTLAALALALPILGFGVAPRVFPAVTPETPFCDRIEMAPGEQGGRPVIVARLCGEQYVLVVPTVRVPSSDANIMEEPQFQLNAPYVVPRDDVPTPGG